MTALPSKADLSRRPRSVGFVPKAEVDDFNHLVGAGNYRHPHPEMKASPAEAKRKAA
jgi:hypothetical protein